MRELKRVQDAVRHPKVLKAAFEASRRLALWSEERRLRALAIRRDALSRSMIRDAEQMQYRLAAKATGQLIAARERRPGEFRARVRWSSVKLKERT